MKRKIRNKNVKLLEDTQVAENNFENQLSYSFANNLNALVEMQNQIAAIVCFLC